MFAGVWFSHKGMRRPPFALTQIIVVMESFMAVKHCDFRLTQSPVPTSYVSFIKTRETTHTPNLIDALASLACMLNCAGSSEIDS
jgi:hypothetical protein